MKILWMCNVKINRISVLQELTTTVNIGGWLEGLSKYLLQEPNLELIYCYPDYSMSMMESKIDKNFGYYAIPMTKKEARKEIKDNSPAIICFEEIIKKENPDIVHFFGTEFLYTNAFINVANAFGKSNRVVTSIQGLVSIYALHFNAGIPEKIIHLRTLSEIKNKTSLEDNRKNFFHRGKYEKQALRKSLNIIGRTSWDRACVDLITPVSKYFFCNETLREEFYQGNWSYKGCNKYQILVSQGSYPIKGLHKVIEAVGYIIDIYPNLQIVVAGSNIYKTGIVHGNTYGRYLHRLILKYHLENNIFFVGSKNEKEMKALMLKSNIFICPSSIENSPNSLGEAMLLGLPTISADVGGVQDMLVKDLEGYVYPFDETYKLAYYIKRIFDDSELAMRIGVEARKHATHTHDPQINNRQLISIYDQIMRG